MIVVIACDVPLDENNGTAVAAVNLVRALREAGETVRILCPDARLAGQPDAYVTEPLNLLFLNDYVRRNGVLLSKKSYRTVCHALDGADLLHTITPFLLCCTAAREAKKRGIPVTSGFHCQAENFSSHVFMMNSRRFNANLYRIFYRNLYRYSDKIHYPSQFIRDTFENAIGKKTPGEVISNGVGSEFVKKEVARPPEYRDRFVILFTGRYSKEKSHQVLIDAASKSKFADKLQLIFAGDGPLRGKLEEYAAEKLKNRPVFGFHPRAELIDIINYADLYVHPAEIEIEAIACLEAIRCGLVPVIADSPRSATRAFALDEKNLFACNDSDSLAERIDYWLSNPEKKRERSAEYLGYTEQFAKPLCMERMLTMIRRTAKETHET